MSEAVVRVEELSKRFGRCVALDRVSLTVARGSVLGLLGPNGAGKTTLIKCLLGLLRPTDGTVRTLGEEPWKFRGVTKARIGYVPQEAQIYPWMKVRDALSYVGAFYPRWNWSLVESLVELWQIPLERRIGSLSPGERQKVAIVLALGHEPELLVLDEPASALDPVARRRLLRTLLELAADEQRTVLYSTHITSDLERLADHVVMLVDGRVAFSDELDVLKDRVKRVKVVASRPLPRTFTLPHALRCHVHGNVATATVLHLDEPLVEQVRKQWNAEVLVEDLNLEEIFLEWAREDAAQ